MNKYRIKVVGKQYDDENLRPEIIELITEGTVKKTEDTYIIDYTDSTNKELEDNKTRLRATDTTLIMTKIGPSSSRMEFEIDKKYSSVYATPYGNFNIEIQTISYENNLNDDCLGTINLKYRINLGGNSSTNELAISISKMHC